MRLKVWLTVAILFALALAGCSAVIPLSGGTAQSVAAVDTLANQVALPGRVLPRASVNLSFPISGAVKTVNVTVGSQVKAGDVLVELDTRDLERDVRRAEAALQVAQAALKVRQMGASAADLAKAESDLLIAQSEPVGALRATAQAATVKALEERITYLRSLPRPEDVAVAQAEVARAQSELDLANGRLDLAVLTAPYDGMVSAVYLNVYEYASSGRAVVQLTNNSDLYVEFRIGDVDLNRFAVGQRVSVSFPGLPDASTGGEVASIIPSDVRSPNGTYIGRVNLDGPVPNLAAGLSAAVLPAP